MLATTLVMCLSKRAHARGWIFILNVLLVLLVRCRYHQLYSQASVLKTDSISQAPKTQDVQAHNVDDRVFTSGSSIRQSRASEEKSTVQPHILPTTSDSMDQMSSLMDTPVLEDYLHDKVLDSLTISPHQPSQYIDTLNFDHLQATESLKPIVPGTWDGMSKYSDGIGGSVLEEEVKKDGEDFPTFDKWSVQYLAEQEKQKNEKDKELTSIPSIAGLTQKKLRHNFAATSCGAKVISSNPEAENVNHLLNGNPDEYMLNPCKVKKWFVVELCEPLQIHRVEIGTVELFASQPKSFRVFASSRYPTKEWTSLGKFDMSPERVIQSFATTLMEEFVKFVKVEMLDHHGDEHYCPLTTFKVLGIDMSDDDFENENEATETEVDAVTDLDEDSVEGSVNLFTSAKETVVKLVQKVWFKGNQGEGGHPEENEANLNKKVPPANVSVDEEGKKTEAVPCTQKDESSGPTVTIPSAGVISASDAVEVVEELPFVTKLTDSEQLPTDTREVPVIIKLDREPSSDQMPSVCIHNLWNSYITLMMSHATSCDVQYSHRHLEPRSQGSSTVTTDDRSSAHTPVQAINSSLPAAHDTNLSVEKLKTSASTDSSEFPSLNATSKDVTLPVESSSLAEKEASTSEITPDQLKHQEETRSSAIPVVDSSQSSSFTLADVSITKSENLEPSSVSSYRALENDAVSILTPGLHIQESQVVEQGATDLADAIFLKVSPSPTLNVEDSQDGLGHAEMPTSIEIPDDKAPEVAQVKDPNQNSNVLSVEPSAVEEGSQPQHLADHSKSQVDVVVNVSQAIKAGKTVDLVKVGMASVGKRDNSVMKLNNRIMALEQNVSMTKKYLEELSRVFKQQNEEMMKLLNKTEKRLTVHMAQAEDKDIRHQDFMDVLEQKVANLTHTVEELQLRLEVLDKKVGDSQCVLLFIQAILILWMFVSKIRGRSPQSLTYSDHQFLLDTMPRQPIVEKDLRQRRNSDTGLGTDISKPLTALKRQRSETNIACVAKADNIAEPHSANQDFPHLGKKKKRKKCKMVVDNESITSHACGVSLPVQTSSFSSSAGVLFGTVSVKDSSSSDIKPLSAPLTGSHCKHPDECPPLSFSKAPWKINLGAKEKTEIKAANKWTAFNNDELRYSCEDMSCHSDIAASDSSSVVYNSSGGAYGGNDNARSPAFIQPSYHRNKVFKVTDTSECDRQAQMKTKPQLKSIKGKHSSLDETRHKDSINPTFGQELLLAENLLSENRFSFLSSPRKNIHECLSVCSVCDQKSMKETAGSRGQDSSLYNLVTPFSGEQLCSHYPVARMDVQPLPAVIICPASLTHTILSGHTCQSSMSSSASSSTSHIAGPLPRRTSYDHILTPPPRPPPPVVSALSINGTAAKTPESRTKPPYQHHSMKTVSTDSSKDHCTGQTHPLVDGSGKKSQVKGKSLHHGASKSMEQEPQIIQENLKTLLKSTSASGSHNAKPSVSHPPVQAKKNSLSKIPNPFRRS